MYLILAVSKKLLSIGNRVYIRYFFIINKKDMSRNCASYIEQRGMKSIFIIVINSNT